jgi:transcriptional regulator with XRE-family HTH domain
MAIVTTSADHPPWRAAREARGLSLRQTARLADIDPAQLSRVERGQSRLSVASMLRLAHVLRLRGLVRQLDRFAQGQKAPMSPSPKHSSGRTTGASTDVVESGRDGLD